MSRSTLVDDEAIPPLTPSGRIGVVGAGAFGRFCIDAYCDSPDMEVLAVADPERDALALVNAPGVRLESDWRAVIHDPAIEVVHLATPPYLRSEMVFTAIEAGKSVFCEKPLALTLREADAMLAAAHGAGVALGVNYVMRHHPLYRLMHRLAASGVMGAPRALSFDNYAQDVPASHWFWDRTRSGGIFIEHGVHFFDVFESVAGEPLSVWGIAPDPRAVQATVQYRSGVLGRFYHQFAFPRAVEYAASTVVFERGRITLEGWIPTSLQGEVLASPEVVAGATPGVSAQWKEEEEGVTQFTAFSPHRQQTYRDAIVAGMRDVSHRHRDVHWKLTVPPQRARASLALAIAAQDAIDQGSVVSCAVAE